MQISLINSWYIYIWLFLPLVISIRASKRQKRANWRAKSRTSWTRNLFINFSSLLCNFRARYARSAQQRLVSRNKRRNKSRGVESRRAVRKFSAPARQKTPVGYRNIIIEQSRAQLLRCELDWLTSTPVTSRPLIFEIDWTLARYMKSPGVTFKQFFL